MGVYYEKIFCYIDNVNSKEEYKRGDQMEAAQRIRLIRIIEKMEKNPESSNKFGMKNTSEYLAEKEPKKAFIRISFRRGKKCYHYCLQFV